MLGLACLFFPFCVMKTSEGQADELLGLRVFRVFRMFWVSRVFKMFRMFRMFRMLRMFRMFRMFGVREGFVM